MTPNPFRAPALIVAAALAACTDGAERTDPGARDGAGVVNLYTARHYDSDAMIYDAFTKATGI